MSTNITAINVISTHLVDPMRITRSVPIRTNGNYGDIGISSFQAKLIRTANYIRRRIFFFFVQYKYTFTQVLGY